MKKVCSVFGILSSLASIVLSIITFSQYTGSYELSKEYGGDAYTGIQNAAAQTANNAHYVAEILAFSLGSLLLVIGLMGLMYFLIKLSEDKQAPTIPKMPAVPVAPATPVSPVAPVVPAAPTVTAQSPVQFETNQ